MKGSFYLFLALSIAGNIYLYSKLETNSQDKIQIKQAALARRPALPTFDLKKLDEKIEVDVDEKDMNKGKPHITVYPGKIEVDDGKDKIVRLPQDPARYQDVMNAWNEQMMEFLMAYGFLNAEEIFAQYKELKKQRDQKVDELLARLPHNGGKTVTLGVDDGLEVSQVSLFYLKKLRKLLGHEAYEHYSALRDKFNSEIINLSQDHQNMVIINF